MTANKSTTHTFNVNGMHCAACVVLTESELNDVATVTGAKSSLANRCVTVTGEFGEATPEKIAENLSTVLKPHGYSLSVGAQKHHTKWSDFKIAIPAATGFIVLFIALQKLGIVNLISTDKVTLGTAFIVGLVASVSTCMAVVGGLVLSMSASFAKDNDKIKPQILFHLGRLISFFLLGGLIGLLGSVWQLGLTGTFILSTIVALVLLLLGLDLLDIFPKIKKIQPTMPNFIGQKAYRLKNLNHTLTPALVGVATFFLPCGFTQSMQIYTLTTGSFWAGALTMFVFALGTLPVLALLSFSSFSITQSTKSGMFFKTVGLIVIFFGIFNLINALVGAGFISPVFNL